MSSQSNPSGRFGPLMKKLKENTGEGDDFDPTLIADTPIPVGEPKAVAKKRAPAKKNNPDYAQTTSYIKRDIYDAATKRLIDEGRVRDYSDLLNDLLSAWLNSGK